MDIPVPVQALHPLVRLTARWAFNPASSWPAIRRRVELTTACSPMPRGLSVTPTNLGSVGADLHTPRSPRTDAVILYLHGGGYATGSPKSHRPLVARLAHACNTAAYALDYRLAPEHRCPAAFEDVAAAYRALLSGGWTADQIVVAGDSAGAALALCLAVAARDELDLPQPAALGLICPPVSHDPAVLARRVNATTDPVLTVDLIGRFFGAYTEGSADTGSIGLLSRDLHGLPPLVIDAAGRDLLLEDARDIYQRAVAAGVRVTYTEHRGQGHVFHIMAGVLSAANRALDTIADRLTAELGARDRRGAGVAVTSPVLPAADRRASSRSAPCGCPAPRRGTRHR